MAETAQERRKRERAAQSAEQTFAAAHKAQTSYAAQLRTYARQIARIVEAYAPKDGSAWQPRDMARLREALRRYSTTITPWARATAWRMIAEVNRRDKTAWAKYTAGMSAAMRQELQQAPTGEAVNAILQTQEQLITSLPQEAARRVHEISVEAMITSHRYPEQTEEVRHILEKAHPKATQQWLISRANLIARTETARAQSVLTQARAQHIGAEEYIWRTAGDWKVRPSHRKLEGTVQRWDKPPLSDPPDHHSHPGQIWNCRCVALPILAES